MSAPSVVKAADHAMMHLPSFRRPRSSALSDSSIGVAEE
jgi:hypothetical protein